MYCERPSGMGELGGVTGIMSTGNVNVAVSTSYCSFESVIDVMKILFKVRLRVGFGSQRSSGTGVLQCDSRGSVEEEDNDCGSGIWRRSCIGQTYKCFNPSSSSGTGS